MQRQVASVTKKIKEPVHNNSHFRTSTPSQSEIYHGTAHNNKPVTEKSSGAEEATSTSHNFGRKRHRRKKTHREVDRSMEHSAVQRQASTSNNQQAREVQSRPTASLTGSAHPPKEKYLFVQQLAITVLKLISGPAHPPKVKYSPKRQNAYTTSHRKTRKLSPSMLRVISSATKTPTRLLKPLHLRTCLAAGSTLSITNLARLPLTVLKT